MSGKALVRHLMVKAVANSTKVAAALTVAGYFGLFLLPFASRDNFFDENSLLTGNTIPDIWAHLKREDPNLVQAVLQSIHKDIHEVPVDELLRRHGLSAHGQEVQAQFGNRSCTNYHTVTPSGRGDGTESLALVTPLSGQCADDQPSGVSFREACWPQSRGGSTMSLALGIVLSKYLASVPWLARDFFWVIPDASCGLLHSTQAWVDAARGYTEPSSLAHGSAHVGQLQQALVLEIQRLESGQGDTWKSAEVSGMGMQGLLPKLDYFMLAEYFLRLDARAHVALPWRRTALLDTVAMVLPDRWPEVAKYRQRLLGMLSFLGMQVGGNPDGAHAAFKGYAVDAVTVRIGMGTEASKEGTATQGKVMHLAAAVEGIMRCSNNLLERLHHSYFMYLQPTTSTFITIEAYVVPPCLLLLGLFVMGVSLLLPVPQSAATTTGQLANAAEQELDSQASGKDSEEESTLYAPKDVFPSQPLQPIQIVGGWNALSRSCCKVLAVHGLYACCGLSLHWILAQLGQGHAVWDSVGGKLSLSVLVAGIVSIGGLLFVLVSTGFTDDESGCTPQEQSQADKAVTLLVTVLLMSAWMFVNWADVYMSLLCLVPTIALSEARSLWSQVVLLVGWVVVNPWAAAMPRSALAFTHAQDVATDVSAFTRPDQMWLTSVSWGTYLLVWMAYVPAWSMPCWIRKPSRS